MNIKKKKGRIKELRVQRTMRILNELLIETIKHYEIISFSLLNKDVGVEIIDKPTFPLKIVHIPIILIIILFSFLGFVIGFVSLLLFYLIKSLKDIN